MAQANAHPVLHVFWNRSVVYERWLLFWPQEQNRYQEYSQLLDELKSTGKAEDAESSAFKLEWQRKAQSAGYKNKTPKERTQMP